MPSAKTVPSRENGLAVYSVDVESKRTRRVLDISSSINRRFDNGNRLPLTLLWSPDVTKLALPLEKSIIIIDITKPAGVVRYDGVAPSLQGWTPDSERIVVTDLPYYKSMGPIIMDAMVPLPQKSESHLDRVSTGSGSDLVSD